MITKKEFDVLLLLSRSANIVTQRFISKSTGYSLGSINNILSSLHEKGLTSDNNTLSANGFAVLDSYKVDNAIIMAAGMSSRFAPLSYEKPKGLLKVKGEVLIERQIRQLMEAGINDITIVVGYMKEQFFYLQDKFNIRIVVNEDYYRYNNTSTLMYVTEQLKNTYICSSDNYFEQNVFNSHEYHAYYSTVYSDGVTNEWCVKTDNKGRIINVEIGGSDAWYMLGHVYFDNVFSKDFSALLKRDYSTDAVKHMLWEEVYINHIKELDIHAKHFESGTILEFDSLDDLRKFDKDYIENTNSKILKNICSALGCKENDITNISTIKNGPSGTSFKFNYNDAVYVYRHPNIHSDEYANHQNELSAIEIAKKLNLYNDLIYMNPEEFWKISYYTDDYRHFNYANPEDVTKAIGFIKKLHTSEVLYDSKFDLWESTESMILKMKKSSRLDFAGFKEFHQLMAELKSYIEADAFPATMCNNDFYDGNILFDKAGSILVSDWKYAGMGDPYGDFGTFICCSNATFDEAVDMLERYHDYDMSPSQKRHAVGCVALASYHWYIWAIYQDNHGTPMGKNTYKWFMSAKRFCSEALKMYRSAQ